MACKRCRKKRESQPLDLALVIGLVHMIKLLGRNTSLRFKFAELEIIEKDEHGARRKAIRHIRETMTAKELGLAVRDPAPSEPHIDLGALFAAGKRCPKCRKGKLAHQKRGGRSFTVCNNLRCKLKWEHVTLKFDPRASKDVENYLTELHESQIIFHWHSLNDPNPIYFAARRGA